MSNPPSQPPVNPPPAAPQALPRMLWWALGSLLLSVLAQLAQEAAPGGLVAVSLYKAHLLALGGWGGYWLDRGLFPYDRPHLYLEGDDESWPDDQLQVTAGHTFGHAMLRRAIVVAACVLCVGRGA